MKAKSSLSSAHLRKILLVCTIFFSLLSTAQTTIVNYNFDVSSIGNYQKFFPRAVNGISCVLTSPQPYEQGTHAMSSGLGGTVTGPSAFTANTASNPNRIVGFTNAANGNSLTFTISGSSLKGYSNFKIYFQTMANFTGRTIQPSYSVDGGAYTNIGSAISIGTSYGESVLSLPAIAPSNTLDIKLTIAAASTFIFRLDNFQVQAIGPSSSSVAVASNHPLAGNIFQNTSTNVLAGLRIDAHITSITPTSIAFTTAGTYTTTDVTNFKLWQNSYNSSYGATQVGSTIASAASGSVLTFNTGISSLPIGTSSYFFLTADVSSSAVAGRTINITTTPFTNVLFSGTPTKIGNNPVVIGTTQTITANAGNATSNINKYTSLSVSGTWGNGNANRWANTSGGTYGNVWIPNSMANLEGTGGNLDVDATTGPVAQKISLVGVNYKLRATTTQVTSGIFLTNPAIINVNGTRVLSMSNTNASNNNAAPLFSSNGFVKEGTGELAFTHPFSIYNTRVEGPVYINGGTLTMGDKSGTNNPNLYLIDNDIFINNGKLTLAATSSTFVSLGLMRSLTIDGTGSNDAQIELYNTATTAAPLYSEPTTDDRYPQLSDDMVPVSIKGTLTFGYGGNISGTSTAIALGNINLTGNSTFKTLTNGAGNLASSSGIITNIQLAGEGGRSGLAGGLVGSYTLNDNGYTLDVKGGGSASADGGYVSVNGGGASSGTWTVGNADGSEAGYLSINDVTGLTTNSITVNQNSQLDINVTGATVNIAKAPTITLNGAKTFSYYGAMALYNSTSGTTTNTLNSPVIVNTSDATVGIYNDAWTMTGAITGSGGFQLWASNSLHNLTLTSSSNTWTGGTKVLSGILNVSSGSAISTGPLAMAQLSGFDTRLNLNNAVQTVSSLTSSWVNTTGTRTQVINLATNHIFTVNQSSNTTYGDGAVNTLTAIISGPGNLIKDGAGTLTLTGANTYTGLTQVKGGILLLSKLYNPGTTAVLPSTNNVHIIGGTLRVSTNQTLNDVILSTGALQVDNGITLTINGMFTLVNGTINLVGTGKIVYGPSGRLTYAGSVAQTSGTAEIPATSGPKGIVCYNNTNSGVTLSANVANLTGASEVYGWLDFNGKTMTGSGGTFTLYGLSGPYSWTGNVSTTSNTIANVSNTSNLKIGMRVTGAAIAASSYIIYIDPLVPNTVTINNNGSGSATGSTVTAQGRGGLKVSMPGGISDGTVNSHVQVTGSNVYNPGANFVFNIPTTGIGTNIYPAFPTVGTLNYSPAYDVYIQAGVTSKVIMGNGHDLEVGHDLTLTSGIFVTNNNLITWANSGGILTSPNVPYVSLSTGANNSYIATCTNTGAELSPAMPYTGTTGFRIKNVGGGTDFYFPVGMNFTSANRMLLNNTGATSDFTVLLKTGDLLQTPGSRVNRIWYVKSSVTSGITANMRLYFTKRDWSGWPSSEDEVEYGFLYNDIHLIQKDYGENFVNKSTGTDVSTVNFLSATYDNTEIYGKYTIGVSPDVSGAKNGINGFTRFSLVNEYIILPVTLTNIKAYQHGNNIMVDWTALNEINIDHYEVERSSTGVSFNHIGLATALNNHAPQNNYGIVDITPLKGNNFYRIKVVGKDGTVSYSAVVFVNINGGKTSISIQPNPVHNRIANVLLNNLTAGKYRLVLYNSTGQEVYRKSIEHGGGSSTQQLLLPSSARPGTYIIKIFNDNVNFSSRVVID